MKKGAVISLIPLSFMYSENADGNMFGFFGDVKELSTDSEMTQSSDSQTESSSIEINEFYSIYKNLPETETITRDFAFLTANPEFQKIFRSHFKRIKIINCRNFHKNKISDQPKSAPRLSATELFSGPAALRLAKSGKKVVVLIFADSTNVGGIYITKGGNPANTQEEQTVLMAPEIYGYLGNNFGVHESAATVVEYTALSKNVTA
ncbi:MAG: hypothetical protein J5821_01720 [Alphaproteobacteria bacterium]|nr:hypothetical protein [Alphaproteobacteria bacterium]